MARWVAGALALVLCLSGTTRVSAQEGGPECPPGFIWRRMSGVGCMQEACEDIANAKYSYTGTCICLDGFKGCTEFVDYDAFDRALCDPFCPTSRLVACVSPDDLCPGEEVPLPTEEVEQAPLPTVEQAVEVEEEEQVELTPEAAIGPDEPTDLVVPALVRDLERFLAGEGVEAPTAGQAAAGAVGLSALLTAWVINNLLSGVGRKDLLKAISLWRRKRDQTTTGVQTSAVKVKASPEEVAEPSEKRRVAVSSGKVATTWQPPEAEVVELPGDAATWPDLPSLRRVRMRELVEAQRRVKVIRELQQRLDRCYRRLVVEWEVARRSAVFEGVVDIADIYLELQGKLTTSTVRGAYGKDLLKRALKSAFGKAVRYRVDGTFEVTAAGVFGDARKSLGVGAPAGGALKQLLQDLAESKGVLGVGAGGSGLSQWLGLRVSKMYGPTESVVSAVGGTRRRMAQCEALREKMSLVRTLFGRSRSALEDARMDLDVASHAVREVDKGIAEMKALFPHRFRQY